MDRTGRSAALGPDLRLLAIDHGDAGARQAFQEIVRRLVKLKYPNARSLDDRSGDWGIDTFVGELDGGVDVVWQAKYFPNGVAEAQKKQIRDALKQLLVQAKKHRVTVSAWTLCLPCLMDPEAAHWWDGFRRRQEKANALTITLWDRDGIQDMLRSRDALEIREAFFGTSQPTPRPAEDVPDPTMFDEALFVAQLRAANVPELDGAKKAYFNAEALAREVVAKGVEDELRELNDLSSDLHQIWEIRFNASCSASSDELLPGMYPRVMDEIKDRDWTHARLPAGLIHRLGAMHQLVEVRRAGWTRAWRDLAARHGS